MNAGKKTHPMEVGNDETRDVEFHCKKKGSMVYLRIAYLHSPDIN